MIDRADERLLQSSVRLADQHCMASMFFAGGTALGINRRDTSLNAARAVIDAPNSDRDCGRHKPECADGGGARSGAAGGAGDAVAQGGAGGLGEGDI